MFTKPEFMFHDTQFYTAQQEKYLSQVEAVKVPGDEGELIRVIGGTGKLYGSLDEAIMYIQNGTEKVNLTKVAEVKKDLKASKQVVKEIVIVLPAKNQPQREGQSKFAEKKAEAIASGKQFYNNYTKKIAKERGITCEEARQYIESKKGK